MSDLKRVLLIAIIGCVAVTVLGKLNRSDSDVNSLPIPVSELNSSVSVAPASTETDILLAQAFQQRLSNLQITGSLPVSRMLPDDNDGSRHQKFILQTSTGQTILVAHNIDLAPRIPNLRVGDTVEFYGEYEWNEKGGVIHWTHHDPDNRHPRGWLRHRGATYQ